MKRYYKVHSMFLLMCRVANAVRTMKKVFKYNFCGDKYVLKFTLTHLKILLLHMTVWCHQFHTILELLTASWNKSCVNKQATQTPPVIGCFSMTFIFSFRHSCLEYTTKNKNKRKNREKFILNTRCRFWIKEKLNIFKKITSRGSETNSITCQPAWLISS